MARGKHAARAARRHECAADEKVVALTAELAEAKATLTELRRRLVEQDGLRAEIARLSRQIEDGTSDKCADLLKRNDELAATITAMTRNGKKWERLQDNMMVLACSALGGGGQAIVDLLNFSSEREECAKFWAEGVYKNVVNIDHILVCERNRANLPQNIAQRERTLARLREAFPKEMANVRVATVRPGSPHA